MKRHTTQDDKQRQGQYFTTNATELLKDLEDTVRNAIVCEPFAGGGDLVEWCYSNGAQGVKAYDIQPQNETIIVNDSIRTPWYEGCDVVVTNPPYLSRNKNQDKRPYEQWGQSDLYKCHLASIVASDIKEGIVILPSNFISESNSKIRDLFFSRFKLDFVRYYRYPVFDDATTGICVIKFSRWIPEAHMTVVIDTHYPDKVVSKDYQLRKEYGWLPGLEFFEYIYADTQPLEVKILREGEGTNILISLLTNGKYPLGAHYNDGETFYASEKTFTTYQVKVNTDMSEDIQRNVVDKYNKMLYTYMNKYESLFLANYMGAEQKIKSRRYSGLLLSRCIKETMVSPLELFF